MAGEKQYRIAGIIPDDLRKEEGEITFEELKEKIIDRVGLKATVTGYSWFSVYKAHHRVAATFQKGTIFLADDAGHVHSPAGGQGMNTGIQDAYNLAWKLAYVIKGYATAELLQTYSEERVQNAHQLINKTDRLYAAEVGGGLAGWLRSTVLPVIGKPFLKTDFARNVLFDIVSQTGISYEETSLAESDIYLPKVNAVDRLPYFEYVNQEQQTSTYSNLVSPRFKLIICSDTIGTEEFEQANAMYAEPMDIVRISKEANRTALKRVFGYIEDFALLVRPDNHIALITDQITVERILAFLTKKMHVLPAMKVV